MLISGSGRQSANPGEQHRDRHVLAIGARPGAAKRPVYRVTSDLRVVPTQRSVCVRMELNTVVGPKLKPSVALREQFAREPCGAR